MKQKVVNNTPASLLQTSNVDFEENSNAAKVKVTSHAIIQKNFCKPALSFAQRGGQSPFDDKNSHRQLERRQFANVAFLSGG